MDLEKIVKVCFKHGVEITFRVDARHGDLYIKFFDPDCMRFFQQAVSLDEVYSARYRDMVFLHILNNALRSFGKEPVEEI